MSFEKLPGCFVEHFGHQKLVDKKALGRYFFPWLSFPNLSKAARAAASPKHSIEFDQPAAVAHAIIQLAAELRVSVPFFHRYRKYKRAWREATSKYFGLGTGEAKRLLQKAVFGFAHPVPRCHDSGVLPFLTSLAQESAHVRKAACEAYPGVYRAMVAAGRPRPETSALAFLAFDIENKITLSFWEHLQANKWIPVVPIFNAVIGVPCQDGVSAEAVLDSFEAKHGVRMQDQQVESVEVEIQKYLVDIFEDLLESDKISRVGDVKVLTGARRCVSVALANLFPDDEDLLVALGDQDGPETYRQVLTRCSEHICFESETYNPNNSPKSGSWIVHEERVGQPFGHAYGFEISGGRIRVFVLALAGILEMPRETFWASLQLLPGFSLIRVKRAPSGGPKKKKAKVDAGDSVLDLLAGADDSERFDVADRMADCVVTVVQKEVAREVQRLESSTGRRRRIRVFSCVFCPFRSFKRRGHLLTHVKKYHTKKRLFMASDRSEAQWNVVLALFEQEQARRV